MLEEQVNAVRNDEQAGTLEKVRCIGYLAATMLKAVEQTDLKCFFRNKLLSVSRFSSCRKTSQGEGSCV